jgi:hypothetical protein
LGTDGNVNLFWNNSSSSTGSGWHSGNLTGIAGAPLAATGSTLFSYTDAISNNQDVYYVGSDQHVHLLWWNGDPWRTLDLTATTGGPNAVAGTPFVRYNNGNAFAYLGTDGNVNLFWNNSSSSTGSGWHSGSLTGIAGAPLAATGSTLFSYTDAISNNQDVYYVGSDQHVHLLWWNGDPWRTLDLTATTGGPTVPR